MTGSAGQPSAGPGVKHMDIGWIAMGRKAGSGLQQRVARHRGGDVLTAKQKAHIGLGAGNLDQIDIAMEAQASVSWEHRIDASWGVNTVLGVERRLGDAAKSPIVQRKSAPMGAVYVTYRY